MEYLPEPENKYFLKIHFGERKQRFGIVACGIAYVILEVKLKSYFFWILKFINISLFML